MKKLTDRALRARLALAALMEAPPERHLQARENWLFVATPGEVRRGWRAWMGPMPGWARGMKSMDPLLAAAALGRIKTPAKAAAVRKNGLLGGRPRLPRGPACADQPRRCAACRAGTPPQ